MTPGFATAKGAQRMLAQSLARDLGPKGVHCFYVIVDGSIGNDSGVTGTNESRKVVKGMVARWQNLIPSFPWIAPGWRAWRPRKGRDQILQRSVAEP